MVFCPEHPKRDQNLKFTPLSETTSIPVPFIWESHPGNGGLTNILLVCMHLNFKEIEDITRWREDMNFIFE